MPGRATAPATCTTNFGPGVAAAALLGPAEDTDTSTGELRVAMPYPAARPHTASSARTTTARRPLQRPTTSATSILPPPHSAWGKAFHGEADARRPISADVQDSRTPANRRREAG